MVIARHLTMLLLATVICTCCIAQGNKGTLSFQMSFPQGEYKEKNPVSGTGLIFGFVHPLENHQPFSIGIEFGILQVNGANKNYTGNYNGEYNTFVVGSWNHILTLAPTLAFDFLDPEKPLRLYMEITFGANLFLTSANVSRDLYYNPITHEEVIEFYFKENHADIAFRAGGGLGLEIPLGHNKKTAVLCKVSYLYGSRAVYYGHPEIKNTQIILSPKASETSMVVIEAGIRFALFNKKQ